MPEKKPEDTVLQNTNDGYVETPVEEIPLSDAAGEGRAKGGVSKERAGKSR